MVKDCSARVCARRVPAVRRLEIYKQYKHKDPQTYITGALDQTDLLQPHRGASGGGTLTHARIC